MRRFAAILVALACPALHAADKPTAEQLDYFEKHVRPVLLAECVRCHGEKKQEAGLRLDTAAGLKKGTDAGPAVVAGEPDKSSLIKSVRRKGEFPMPPDKELPKEQVDALVQWVKVGAAFPESAAKPVAPNTVKTHWAFQPVSDPVPPAVPNARTPLDQFVVKKLQEKNLSLSPQADKRTLIRRAYFDLIGLPPTAEEIEAFEKDAAPDAFAKLVDKLLAMPQYGERWGRHWLDVARYADTKGYVFTEDRNYPYAYTYRDYVINAFNADKPYNRFVVEQLAADKLVLGADKTPLAAMGFLTVGRRFSNNMHDIIDDRIDLVGRGLMGLSIGCARCHDHKFDPIPTADYYSLYGVFSSSNEPKELPLIAEAERTPAALAFEAELQKMEQAAADFEQKMYAEALAPFKRPGSIADMLLATKETKGFPSDKADKWAVERKLDPRMLDRWRTAVTGDDPIFAPWLAFTNLPEKDFGAKAKDALAALKKPANAHVVTILKDAKPQTIGETAAVYAQLLADAAKGAVPNADGDWQALVTRMVGDGGITNPLPGDTDKLVLIATKKVFRKLRNDAALARVKSPFAPPRAMVLNDNARPTEPVVFLRGNPGNRGPRIPRQMPEITVGLDRKPFTNGSGRLELANSIVGPTNPLTARVIVNRVWTWHFGQGLVRTPSDFGLRSDPPTHPELLDWLAKRFATDDGWSIKNLHRRIMLTAAYQQASVTTPAMTAADPENRLLGRFNRQRLDFEGLRDSLLSTAGTLDRSKIGGRSVDLFTAPFTPRRSVYGFVDRQNLAGTLRAFDFASPDQHTPQRFQTTVPQQALFLMNSPFIGEVAKGVGTKVSSAKTTPENVTAVYRTVLSRNPTPAELALADEFLQTPGPKNALSPWEQLAQVLLLSNEFAFVD
ncbi:PSD1 and planctomycete cytochrome C domain-containing protein [Limnoglobus roseus]|uniref:Cytochrome c domain-containing protein n=1 Tax=Limnoglobus roseus TaxID=2598579 RepID=A0A5C1A5H7_9BACT|nr:PSD1 and planctomycete cytochrome C domain-containing protein [Limnoglobus roseus]QEL13603.1 hypothetical protein PX52LOC_00461 [Limnoglobus roseus]